MFYLNVHTHVIKQLIQYDNPSSHLLQHFSHLMFAQGSPIASRTHRQLLVFSIANLYCIEPFFFHTLILHAVTQVNIVQIDISCIVQTYHTGQYCADISCCNIGHYCAGQIYHAGQIMQVNIVQTYHVVIQVTIVQDRYIMQYVWERGVVHFRQF